MAGATSLVAMGMATGIGSLVHAVLPVSRAGSLVARRVLLGGVSSLVAVVLLGSWVGSLVAVGGIERVAWRLGKN